MRGPSRPIWPVHYKPLPGEVLSSWIVRLAHGHGLKVQTFCNLYCGSDYQVWVRDIDRLPPAWLLDEFSLRTNTPVEKIWETTLQAYEGILFDKMRGAGHMAWILTLHKYHRKMIGHGVQFCPSCLAEDETLFFRRYWRIAFYTTCHYHSKLLRDRCPRCGAAVALHRIDMHSTDFDAIPSTSLATCHNCGTDLRLVPGPSPKPYDLTAATLLAEVCEAAVHGKYRSKSWNLGRMSVLHQMCHILTTDNPHTHLRQYVENRLSVRPLVLTGPRIPLESYAIEDRHHLMQLAAWLMVDLEPRLEGAWKAGAIRYNVLLKDFADPPDWYVQIVEKFANWRNRFT